MQNWQKYSNYRKSKNTDGSYTYIVTVDGENVVVSESVYREYAAMSRKMKYMELDLKRDRVLQDAKGTAVKDENEQPTILPEREVSLDKLIDEDWDFPSSELSPEDVLLAAEDSEVDRLHRCISMLTEDEKTLIITLFFEGKTERQCAKTLGISKTALHARKVKTLTKIKTLMEQ